MTTNTNELSNISASQKASRSYYYKHKEKVAAYKKAYNEANKEKVSKRQKRYRANNLEKCKKREKEYCKNILPANLQVKYFYNILFPAFCIFQDCWPYIFFDVWTLFLYWLHYTLFYKQLLFLYVCNNSFEKLFEMQIY